MIQKKKKNSNQRKLNSRRKIKWFSIDWRLANAQVKQCQKAIAVAYLKGDLHQVKLQQHKLVNSFSRKRIAVKTISSNKGKNTPGIDKVIWNTPEAKFQAIVSLKADKSYKAKPVKRVYIPKRSGKLRPLGIPCMMDRAMQTQWKLALEPIAECTRDTHSYGFRPGRNTQDCQQLLWLLCSGKHGPKWVLEADIKGFYDNIHHNWLQENIPMDKHIQKQFQKAGFMENHSLQETTRGVPQGGTISPVIANMTLDGLEKVIAKTAEDIQKQVPKPNSKKTSTWVHTIRYADDFVITGANKKMLDGPICRAVNRFLRERGESLNAEKTHITSVKKGFDFLGFHFKLYPSKKKYVFIVKPAKNNIQKVKDKIKAITKDKNLSALDLIQILNPILMGWANYFSKVVSSKVFQQLGMYVWYKTFKWRKKKHPHLTGSAVADKYYTKVENRKWVFYTNYGNKKYFLYPIRKTPIVRHSQIKKGRNPYLPEFEQYFKNRIGKIAKASVWRIKTQKIRKKTNFLCKVCDGALSPGQELDIHHVLPKKLGGTDNIKNLIVLHRECHKQVTNTKSLMLQAQFKEMGIVKS